jgi:hypothetical protein
VREFEKLCDPLTLSFSLREKGHKIVDSHVSWHGSVIKPGKIRNTRLIE